MYAGWSHATGPTGTSDFRDQRVDRRALADNRDRAGGRRLCPGRNIIVVRQHDHRRAGYAGAESLAQLKPVIFGLEHNVDEHDVRLEQLGQLQRTTRDRGLARNLQVVLEAEPQP